MRKKCPYSKFFCPISSSIWTEYDRDTPHLSVFSLNAAKYGLEKLQIRALFTQWNKPLSIISKSLISGLPWKTTFFEILAKTSGRFLSGMFTRKGFALDLFLNNNHCVKSVHIQSYSCPQFPAFGLYTERYSVSLRIQSEGGKIRTRITSNRVTFYAIIVQTNCKLLNWTIF